MCSEGVIWVLVCFPKWQSNSTYCFYISLLWKLRLPPFDAWRLSKSEAHRAPCCEELSLLPITAVSVHKRAVTSIYSTSTTQPSLGVRPGWILLKACPLLQKTARMGPLASPLPTSHLPDGVSKPSLKLGSFGKHCSTHGAKPMLVTLALWPSVLIALLPGLYGLT